MNPITAFEGEYRFLSNFFPCHIVMDGASYGSVEAAYQAAKTDDVEKRIPLQTASASTAKRLGRTLPLRPDWNTCRLAVMELLLRQKFAIGTDLRNRLDATAPRELIEGNWWGDTFWGVCRGKGENHLGKLLMKIRDGA